MRSTFVHSAVLPLALIFLIAAPQVQALSLREARDKPDEWLKTDEGGRAIDNILIAQLPDGGWRKGYDLLDAKNPVGTWPQGTFDNGSTYTELRLLAKAYQITQRKDALDGFNRGLGYIVTSQYPSGGWPQRSPPTRDYGRYITFNDHAMTRVMELLFDVVHSPEFSFVDAELREKASQAFDRGVDCIVKLQIVVNGKPTGWAQQYDEVTFQPVTARTYELPGITGDETSGIVRLLMRVEDPKPEVRRAIHTAVAWLEASKVTGLRMEKVEDPSLPRGFDMKVVEDPAAPPLWARFYDIETNRPFYCGRDGAKKWSLAEIEPERRSGYAWLRPYAEGIAQRYKQWAAKHVEVDS